MIIEIVFIMLLVTGCWMLGSCCWLISFKPRNAIKKVEAKVEVERKLLVASFWVLVRYL